MKFSVAIHTFNRKALLIETINSILQQTYKPDEIILLDDGSTDNTEDLIKSQFGEKIKYTKTQNTGAGESRHRAIELCGNEWIACVDDDDIWHPNHLQELKDLITNHPDCDFAFTNYTHYDHKRDKYNHFGAASSSWWQEVTKSKSLDFIALKDSAYLGFLSFNPVSASNFCFKKSKYIEIGGSNINYSRMNSEDADLTRRFILHSNSVCSQKITVSIRKHEKNMSALFYKNQYGKATMLNDYVKEGIVPKQFRKVTIEARNKAISSAIEHSIWNKDYQFAIMADKKFKDKNLRYALQAKLLFVKLFKTRKQ